LPSCGPAAHPSTLAPQHSPINFAPYQLCDHCPARIMQFGKSVGTACSSFAITNIDDIFVLVTFFAEASTSETVTPLKITIGQYIGFTVITAISLIGFGVSLVLPSEPIGFLGLLPILLGIWNLFDLLFPKKEEEEQQQQEEEADKSNIAGVKSILKVAAITVMNGGDNIGTYIPLFSQAKGAEIAVYVVVYYILVGAWCLVAFLFMKQKHILRVAEKYASVVVPFLYVGLGIYIIVKSSCYPWSIEHIDDTISSHPGTTIMAVVTTVLLLACIGAMLWFRLRGKAAQPTPDMPSTGHEAETIDDGSAAQQATEADTGRSCDATVLKA
jgi:cadmium resistance protein CadD (predicted permease)